MSRTVVSKTMKTASLNLGGMADRQRVDVSVEDIHSMLEGKDPKQNYTWEKETSKPEALETTIEQIKSIFNVGKEVESWSASYYAPPQKNEKGKPIESELRIEPVQKGLGGRFVILVGTKEVPTLEISMGSSGAHNEYLLMDGDCMYLKLTVCPVLTIVFSNNYSEKMAPRKGFREMIIKKNLYNRHILVIDAHVSMGAVAEKVKKELIGVSSEEVAEKLFRDTDYVAELASKKGKESKESSSSNEPECSKDV
jgi:hypothetical protein